MAESRCPGLTGSEMAAARQLMQVSDEDSNKIRSRSSFEDEEVDQNLRDIISAKIEEIFGKDYEFSRPKKQRRYRSIASLYMDTRPINSGNRKKERDCSKTLHGFNQSG